MGDDDEATHVGHVAHDRGGVAVQAVGQRGEAENERVAGIRGFLGAAERSNEALAIMGMDWVRRSDGGNFFSYHSQETRERLTELCGMVEQGTPSILLAHHPDKLLPVPLGHPVLGLDGLAAGDPGLEFGDCFGGVGSLVHGLKDSAGRGIQRFNA